jgi:hypothetical protein
LTRNRRGSERDLPGIGVLRRILWVGGRLCRIGSHRGIWRTLLGIWLLRIWLRRGIDSAGWRRLLISGSGLLRITTPCRNPRRRGARLEAWLIARLVPWLLRIRRTLLLLI